jgi:hypothetical protein
MRIKSIAFNGNCLDAILSGVWVLTALLVAAPALASSPTVRVSSANLSIDQTATDSYSISGSLDGLSLEDAQTIKFGVGQFGADIPLSAFVHKGGTDVYSYKDASGLSPYWLSSLTIDLGKDTFSASASGIVLSGLGNPFQLRIGTNIAVACGTVRVRNSSTTSHTETYELTPGEQPTAPCSISGPPVASPATIPVKAETKVTMVMNATGLDAKSARLFLADVNAHPTGSALCTFDLSRDGSYSCTAAFTPSKGGPVPLVVEATVKGEPVYSPGFFVQAVATATSEEILAQIVKVQGLLASGDTAYEKYGDSVSARVKVLEALRQSMPAQSGLTGQPVQLSPGGSELSIIVPSGVPINYNISNPQPPPTASAQDANLHQGTPLREVAPTGDTQGLNTAQQNVQPHDKPQECGDFARQIVANINVLLWNPGSIFWSGDEYADGGSPGDQVADVLEASKCPHFNVVRRDGPEATLAELAKMKEYGTVIISTHGFVDSRSRHFIVSGEEVPWPAGGGYEPPTDKPDEQGIWCNRDEHTCYQTIYSDNPLLQVSPNTIVYGGFCDGFDEPLQLNGFSIPLVDEWGAVFAGDNNAFIGYSGVVYVWRQEITDGKAVFNSLLKSYSNVLEAVQAAADPQMALGEGFDGGNGHNLAYVGNPHLVLTRIHPKLFGSQVLAATLEGTASCVQSGTSQNMNVNWMNPATAGHLVPSTKTVSGSQESFTDVANCDATGGCDANNIPITIPPTVSNWALAEYTPDALLSGNSDKVTADFYPDPTGDAVARACLTVQPYSGLFLESELATGYNVNSNFSANPKYFTPYKKVIGTESFVSTTPPSGTSIKITSGGGGSYTATIAVGAANPNEGYASFDLSANNPGPPGKAKVKIEGSWTAATQAELKACASQPTCNFPDGVVIINSVTEFSLYDQPTSPFSPQTLDSSAGPVDIYVGMNGNAPQSTPSTFTLVLKIQFMND